MVLFYLLQAGHELVRERKEAEESFTLTLELRLFFFIKLHAGTEIVLLYKVAFETRVKVHELRGKSKADLFAQLKDLKAKLALLCVAKMNVEMLQKMAGVVSTIKKGGGSHDVGGSTWSSSLYSVVALAAVVI
ncbi:hypothetical protein Tco_0481177 [Tanacetum coccineum]